MTIVTVGFDIAKQIFQAHGVDRTGRVVLRKRLKGLKWLRSLL
jgi:transposase